MERQRCAIALAHDASRRWPTKEIMMMMKTFFPVCSPKNPGFPLAIFLALVLAACTHKVPVTPPSGSIPSPGTLSYPQKPPQPSDSGAKVVEKCILDPGTTQTITHEVAPLETVWRISKMYDVAPEAIYAANSLRPGNPIHQGQKLIIPNAKGFRNVIALYPNSRWKYIVIHHTATDVGKAYLINRSHQDRGFWNGLGYHFLIDNGTLGKGDGQIEVAPRWIKQQSGAHCNVAGMNEKGIGIALVGNFNGEVPTANQLQSLNYLLKTLSQYYHIPATSIIGHRDAPGAATECPGKRFPMASVRQCLAKP
jgi:N-acetylmuramoyl-L-alanine amidase